MDIPREDLVMRLTRHDNSDWLLRCWLLVAETLPTH
jgi:hypothetical protein